eukprot:Ihof_evm1s211 gene=Ihof_evmTU1s211
MLQFIPVAAQERLRTILLNDQTSASSFGPSSKSRSGADGKPETFFQSDPEKNDQNPWWEIAFGQNYITTVKSVLIQTDKAYSDLGEVAVTVGGKLCKGLATSTDGNMVNRVFTCDKGLIGKYMRVTLVNPPQKRKVLTINEVKVFGIRAPIQGKLVLADLLAENIVTSQSSTYQNDGTFDSSKAVDNDLSTMAQTAANGDKNPYWTVDLHEEYEVTLVKIYNRLDNLKNLKNAVVTVDGKPCGSKVADWQLSRASLQVWCGPNVRGKTVKIQLENAHENGTLALPKVDVWGVY